jgi:transcriptional regulator with XRE-family HTH domain
MQMRVGEKTLQELGAKLKKLRQHFDLTRLQMASRFKVTPSAYSKNESGLTFPGLPSLRALCLELDVSMDWLLFDKGPMIFEKKAPPPETAKQPPVEKKAEEEPIPDKKAATPAAKELAPDVKELFEHMENIPLLHYQILAQFQQFKVDNPELVKSAVRQQK